MSNDEKKTNVIFNIKKSHKNGHFHSQKHHFSSANFVKKKAKKYDFIYEKKKKKKSDLAYFRPRRKFSPPSNRLFAAFFGRMGVFLIGKVHFLARKRCVSAILEVNGACSATQPPPQPQPLVVFGTIRTALASRIDWYHCHRATATPSVILHAICHKNDKKKN
jgi:hypothetical protein